MISVYRYTLYPIIYVLLFLVKIVREAVFYAEIYSKYACLTRKYTICIDGEILFWSKIPSKVCS